ncbi:MAG TPA: hypothetical protein VFA18_12700 [Gemmataceae bacterium]|nr:hypothetical protein [Gemmataceae bacterium]
MSVQQKLLHAMAELEKATANPVTGSGQAWSQYVDKVLAELEDALRRHAQEIAGADGQLVAVDRPLIPSPTLQHRGAHLAEELHSILGQTQSLRREFRELAPVANQPQRELFCQRARQLVQDLERCESQEADLIQDSVTTDIGAGD